MAPNQGKDSYDGYVEGAITHIQVKDFLTYDSCEIKPGPHLNMIIGPNTSGKSSIVCAICLGLAGKTSFLGRAASPAEYIKHGSQKATIEITLYNPDGDNYVIKREISRSNNANRSAQNKSEWYIGGRPATQKAVEELVLRLNVQMSNLCQFLPQDKVADFAKMSQQELLESTEKAAGPVGMYEKHQKLKEAREKSRTLERQVTNTSNILEQEKQKNARLETDVKNYQARQKHLEQIKILKMKRAWVEYEDKRKLYQDLKVKKDELGEQLKKAKQDHAPLKRRIDAAQEKIVQLNRDMKEQMEVIRQQARLAASKSEKIENEADNAKAAEDEFKGLQTQEKQRRDQLSGLKRLCETLKAELAQVEGTVEIEGLQQQIEQCNRQIRQLNAEMNNVQRQGETIQAEVRQRRTSIHAVQGQLQKLQDLSNQRLEMLRHKHRETYNAVIWLRANKQKFKKTIHEPLMLIINVSHTDYAKYVENHISFNDMKAFVCEDPEDMEVFMQNVRDQQRLSVNAVMAPKESPHSFQPKTDLETLRPFGFNYYLRDLFECPDAVMAYLCKLYNVHNVPVGNEYTKRNIQMVTEQLKDLQRFYTQNHSYSIRRSRYTGDISSRCTEIKRPQLLTLIIDEQQERSLKQELTDLQLQLTKREDEYRQLQSTHKDHERCMNELRNQKKQLCEKRDQSQSLKQRIRTKESNIARVEKDAIDLEKERASMHLKLSKINERKLKLMKEMLQHTQLYKVAGFEKLRMALQQAALMYQQKALEFEIREQSNTLQQLERDFDAAKERLKDVKDVARTLLLAAHKATSTKQNEELSPEMTQAFSVLPNSIEEIDTTIHQETARAECTYNTDAQVVEEYNRRKKDIAKQTIELANRETALERHNVEVEEIKGQWIGPLQDLIRRIDTNFGRFFSSMNCAGEVDLNIPENQEDYEKYGVRIKVKYRDNEPLRELTPHHQSGGERSVATVLYMMALQELTKCPFRCVDEINQGMDPQNERKVFELVVATACRKDTSQYFLLTPKLLPDLEYGDRMTILCVYNGPQMVNHEEWNLKKFLRRRTKITAQES